MPIINNRSGWVCGWFLRLPVHIHPSPPTLFPASGGWGVHYIKGSQVIWIPGGFWLGPGRMLEVSTVRETEARVFSLLGPSLCGCSLDWQKISAVLKTVQDSLFLGPGTYSSLIPLGLDTGSHTTPGGSSAATSYGVIPSLENPHRVCRLLSAGTLTERKSQGRRRGEMPVEHLRTGRGVDEKEGIPLGEGSTVPRHGASTRREQLWASFFQNWTVWKEWQGMWLDSQMGLVLGGLISKFRSSLLFTTVWRVPEGFWLRRWDD